MIKRLLHAGVPFAVYKLPGSGVPVVVFQHSTLPEQVFLPGEALVKGFYFMPFSAEEIIHGFRIRPDVVTTETELSDDMIVSFTGHQGLGRENIHVPLVTRDHYLEKIDAAKKVIRTGSVEKIVLSRPMGIPLPADFDPDAFFRSLTVAFPELFTFFVHLPGRITWAGATPELLLQQEKNELILSALAGTQSGRSRQEPLQWSEKEKHEHALVGKHILEMVRETGLEVPVSSGTNTFWSGSLAHLRTLYKMQVPEGRRKVEELICRLQPTPAVGGYPANKALPLIRELEGYPREFYAGFLGPWEIKDHSSLFVNLRSVQLTSQTLVIYAGGGITEGSDPEKEWEETAQKARAMLSVLEKMPNFA